jgi:hypothetical protein
MGNASSPPLPAAPADLRTNDSLISCRLAASSRSMAAKRVHPGPLAPRRQHLRCAARRRAANWGPWASAMRFAIALRAATKCPSIVDPRNAGATSTDRGHYKAK